MNMSQLNSFIRSLLKVIGSALAAHGATTAGNWINTEDVIGVVCMVAGLLWSHFHHDSPPAASQPSRPNVPLYLLLACLVLPAIVGCAPTNITKLTSALSRDPAIVSAKVSTIYGTASLVRVGVTTNVVSVAPDGTVTVGR